MISKTVSLSEATRSNTAVRFGIDNTPNEAQKMALADTAVHVVDAVRKQFGETIDITSFFRSEKLNKKIGGAKGSQHTTGEAVDLDSRDNALNLAIFNFVKDNLTFDQLILEAPDDKGVPSWVHCSYVQHPKQNRGQILVYLASSKKYIPFGEFKIGMT